MKKSTQDLLDEAEIRDVQIRYCRGIDRMDWELIRSCYHPDAVDDHGDYFGGIDGFIEYVKKGAPTFKSTNHFTGNQLVEVDGDVAWAEHYAIAYHRYANGAEGQETDLIAIARYVDRMERRDGEWRIAKRVVIIDSERSDPVMGAWGNPILRRGRRDQTDPSYTAR